MVIVNELFCVGRLSGHNRPPVLLPYAVDFLQLVGVDPRTNHVFVLFFFFWSC